MSDLHASPMEIVLNKSKRNDNILTHPQSYLKLLYKPAVILYKYDDEYCYYSRIVNIIAVAMFKLFVDCIFC